MRLLLVCTELGLGHVTRLIPLGKKLQQKGHELYFFSGATAFELLRKEFPNVYPCTPVAWYETTRGVLASASLLNILIPIPYYNHEKNRLEVKTSSASETIHRYYDLRKHIHKIKPDLIIADGDIHALRLAHRWKIPSVYITNIIRPSHAFSPLLLPGERFTERYVKKCTRIIIPDNPEPYTICQYNLGNFEDINIRDKVEFTGTFIDMTPIEGSEEYIFAPISGPVGTRAKLIQTMLPVLQKLEIKSKISLGTPGKKIVKQISNCTLYSWLSPEERREFMAKASLIVFSGGHATCFETIKYRKPSICIPTQPEQMGNAWKLQQLGCSMTAKNKEQLSHAIGQIQESRRIYRTNVDKLYAHSSRFKSLDKAASIIEKLLN